MLARLYPLCYYDSGCIVSVTIQKGECNTKLAELRKAQGITQERLSELSGVSRVTIARFETGKVSPTLLTLERLAAALGVTIADVAGVEA